MTYGKFALRTFGLGLMLAACPALAKKQDAPQVKLELAPTATSAEFAVQRQKIESAIADPEAYSEMRAEERTWLKESMAQMGGNLETAGSVAALPDAERAALMTDQQKVNDLLARARHDSRLVCSREKTLGSSMRRTVCLTVAQRRRSSDEARGMVNPES